MRSEIMGAAPRVAPAPDQVPYDPREILAEVLKEFPLRHDRSHGVGHWARVLTNGRRLAKSIDVPLPVVELFALLHDSRRVSEGVDREHGPRAATYALELARRGLIRLPTTDLDLLAFACLHHSTGRRDGPLIAQVCWDADRLDLGRVGITPLPERLCTDAAREPGFFAYAVAAGRARDLPKLIALDWGLEWEGNRVRIATGRTASIRLLFHGTFGPLGQSALEGGFRFRRHEPTLTFDLATACLVYATPEQHPNSCHSSDGDGICLAVRPKGWVLAPSPTSCLWISPHAFEVHGGVTSWIGGYQSVYRASELPTREEHRLRFVAGELRNSSAWKRERAEYLTLPREDIVAATAVTPILRTWLTNLDLDLRGGAPVGLPPDEICDGFGGIDGRALFRAIYEARACRWIRRLFLSILAARGVPVYSTDVKPWRRVAPPALWGAADAESRLHGLEASLSRRSGLEALRTALEFCRTFLTVELQRYETAEILTALAELSESRESL